MANYEIRVYPETITKYVIREEQTDMAPGLCQSGRNLGEHYDFDLACEIAEARGQWREASGDSATVSAIGSHVLEAERGKMAMPRGGAVGKEFPTDDDVQQAVRSSQAPAALGSKD